MERSKPRNDYDCMPDHECMPSCEPMPVLGRRCIGTYVMRYRVYEDCDCGHTVVRVCAYCGCEHDEELEECPMCGAPAELGVMEDDNGNPDGNPNGNPDGFGGFGGFGRRRSRFFPRFRFFPFFFPFFFLFRRRRF
ncbi:MAG: hypothetical protein GX348_01060 [Veillonellaceae bacterium]|nr:hypothetical protein [Veillonellaceae bacterium]